MGWAMRKLLRSAVLGVLAAATGGAAGAPLSDPAEVLISSPLVVPASAKAVGVRCDAILAAATTIQSSIEGASGPSTVAGTFAPFDRLSALIGEGASEAYLVSQANPDKSIRDAAEACVQRISDFATALQLSQPVYARLAAIRTSGLDAETAWVLKRQLLQFRLAGVDRDAATRAKIADLQKRISATGLQFDGNIRDAPYEVTLPAGGLAGMPADFCAATDRMRA